MASLIEIYGKRGGDYFLHFCEDIFVFSIFNGTRDLFKTQRHDFMQILPVKTFIWPPFFFKGGAKFVSD